MPLLPAIVLFFFFFLLMGGGDVVAWLWDHRSGIWTGIVWTTIVIIVGGLVAELSERLSRIK